MCVFEGGVRVERGGTFCGDVVLFTERWCFLLRGSARTYARVYKRALCMCVLLPAAYSDVVKPLLITYFEQVQV